MAMTRHHRATPPRQIEPPNGSGANLRILHLIATPKRRGAQVFATQLVTELAERFHHRIVSLHRAGGGEVIDLPGLVMLNGAKAGIARLTGIDWRTFRVLRRDVLQFRPDLLVAHGAATINYAAPLKALGLQAPLAYRCIGTPSFWVRSRLKAALMSKLLFSRVSEVVCTSHDSRRDFLRTYGFDEARVSVIENGVDLAAFDEPPAGGTSLRRELGVDSGTPLLLAVGSLTHEKGPDLLLSALKRLRHAGRRAHLAFVGDGPMRPELEAEARRLGLDLDVRFLGQQGDVVPFLRAADLFVLPSRTEGMPAALIEAGLAGLPAVAFDVGGVGEVITSGVDGILARPGDIDGLVSGINSLLDDSPSRRRMAATAAETWRDRFGMPAIAERYAAWFQDVARHHSPARRGR